MHETIPEPKDGDIRVIPTKDGRFYIEEYQLDPGDWWPRPPGWFTPVDHTVAYLKLDPRTAAYFDNREDAETAAIAYQAARKADLARTAAINEAFYGKAKP